MGLNVEEDADAGEDMDVDDGFGANDDGDEAHSKKVASAMERLIHSQLDRVLEIQEVEEVRQARRARAASSNNGEPALSQMTQGNDDDERPSCAPSTCRGS